MKIKDQIRRMLYRMGKINVLPASVINSVKIVENHDPMVDIKEDANFFFNDALQKETHVYLRKSVYEKLKSITLPEGYYFKIMSAYRSLEEQKIRWENKCSELRKKYPNISEEELIIKVKALCADPRAGFGGHQTGGAIDITLCDKHGKDYDMGTDYRSTSPQNRTDSNEIGQEQANNRKILFNTLQQLDFANYPIEWWHYSYGDRLWAAYNNKNQCMYGMPSEQEFVNTADLEKNDISISFSVPKDEKKQAYEGELVLNELQGCDTRNLAKIACDMAWNDTLLLLLKSDEQQKEYEQFIKEKTPDLTDRWNQIMEYRPIIVAEAEKVLNKPFSEMSTADKSQLYSKIDKKTVPLDCWHINFSQLNPDLGGKYDAPEDAFYSAAQNYILGAAQRRKGNKEGVREGFWLAIRDKETNGLMGVMAISTKIIKGNLIGHSARFISPDFQRKKIAGTAGFVALDFMYKYLADKEQPNLYKGEDKPLFATTCHPFNSASRGLQMHNGADFSQYNAQKHKFEYTTTREAHEQKINQAQAIMWNAQYKGLEISSNTGTKYDLSVRDYKSDASKMILVQKNIDKRQSMK